MILLLKTNQRFLIQLYNNISKWIILSFTFFKNWNCRILTIISFFSTKIVSFPYFGIICLYFKRVKNCITRLFNDVQFKVDLCYTKILMYQDFRTNWKNLWDKFMVKKNRLSFYFHLGIFILQSKRFKF